MQLLVDVGGLSVSDSDISKLRVSVTQPTGDKALATVTYHDDDDDDDADRRLYSCQYTPLTEGLFVCN